MWTYNFSIARITPLEDSEWGHPDVVFLSDSGSCREVDKIKAGLRYCLPTEAKLN
jgi:hypothetical protein